ncbi:alpha/beta hydrolase [Microbulbifer sp. OS29]|uniref:Alpha/beta hydrolase n=1 Tax=Microbulbifer okhotskensis TaxID=2926617 RepID=A0A9X2ENW6_9GAMM|nr:alpha/beta hydrolase [Microbulbifer okhotskensis]MCO1335707.1 alpha/beta hydrolase [Microbulbifer okhotskensis]
MFSHEKLFTFLLLVMITSNTYSLPSGIKILPDIPYGQDTDQALDVYIPTKAKNAPVIFMVHGGAWSGGDKANKSEFENKVAHWVGKGFIFISTNYRTLPKIKPDKQAKDIEAALLFAQEGAREWGGSSDKFILMGHSSGAHLVSLISSNYKAITKDRITPWLGTISLDISGYDIVKKATGENPSGFYIEKFGNDSNYWVKASPFHILSDKIPPFLAICSLRSDDACTQAKTFTDKAKKLGAYAAIIPIDLSHGEINSELGKDACYTASIDDFLKKLSPDIAKILKNGDTQPQQKCADTLSVATD